MTKTQSNQVFENIELFRSTFAAIQANRPGVSLFLIDNEGKALLDAGNPESATFPVAYWWPEQIADALLKVRELYLQMQELEQKFKLAGIDLSEHTSEDTGH